MWRYTGQYDAGNKYSDGRFRFLIYDTDLVFSTDLFLDLLYTFRCLQPKPIFSTDLFPEFFMGSTGDIFVSLMERINYVSKSLFSKILITLLFKYTCLIPHNGDAL